MQLRSTISNVRGDFFPFRYCVRAAAPAISAKSIMVGKEPGMGSPKALLPSWLALRSWLGKSRWVWKTTAETYQYGPWLRDHTLILELCYVVCVVVVLFKSVARK